ncbi:MAG: tetratricopeptide repeat protein [Terriglobales bacterium]
MSACLSASGLAQQEPQSDQGPDQNQAPPRSDTQKAHARDPEAGESSSRDTRIDTSPPKDDAKNHPNSGVIAPETAPKAPAEAATEDTTSDVHELHPWNPYRAVKDDEVGDFYFKRKNYKAALARYQDALAWKEHDAVATFRIAECYEKLDQPGDAVASYKEYLKILPDGPFSKEAKKALRKLGVAEESQTSQAQPKP